MLTGSFQLYIWDCSKDYINDNVYEKNDSQKQAAAEAEPKKYAKEVVTFPDEWLKKWFFGNVNICPHHVPSLDDDYSNFRTISNSFFVWSDDHFLLGW